MKEETNNNGNDVAVPSRRQQTGMLCPDDGKWKNVNEICGQSSLSCVNNQEINMPYVYVGKRNFYLGKRLWEIVGNLKNFGEGRILVRSKFERYPEVSYVKIVKAEPLMDEENLFGRVLVEKVFRGRSIGEYDLSKTAYKNDFKLVPKDEEEFYLSRTMKAEEVEKLTKKLPEFIEFPPLLRKMIAKQENNSNPLLKAVYNIGPHNLVCIEPNSVCRKTQIQDTKAPRLYENLNNS